jgi:photosystem II stability/assembly factor-like uncharacterized protein
MLTPASANAITHIHGLAVSLTDPDILYVATHHGLLQRTATGQFFWVGEDRSDHMGFAIDPSDPNRFYRSGHPVTGGNLGFQSSDDQGQTWQLTSMPNVDFHAIAIAPSQPATFYGWATSGALGLFVSTDNGQSWSQTRMAGLEDLPFEIAVHPTDPNHLFLPTRAGIYESRDGGNQLEVIPGTQDTPIVGLTLQMRGSDLHLYGYRALQTTPGFYRSTDGGQTWDPWGSGFEGALLRIVISPHDSDIYFAANQDNQLYRSPDQGKTWQELNWIE